MMCGSIQVVFFGLVFIAGVSLRPQQSNFDSNNFPNNVRPPPRPPFGTGALESASGSSVFNANSFASSSSSSGSRSVVFSDGSFNLPNSTIPQFNNLNVLFDSSGHVNSENVKSGNKKPNNNPNKGTKGPVRPKPISNPNNNSRGDNDLEDRSGNSNGFSKNPFLPNTTTSKPSHQTKSPQNSKQQLTTKSSKPRTTQGPYKTTSEEVQGNKINKKPATVTSTSTNKNKNKKNKTGNGQKSQNKNKPMAKKRVGEIRYEQYLSSIFPDSEDVVQDMDLNGRELARPGQYPHMGAIGFRNTVLNKTEYKCGASLISYDFVVTSAHCTSLNGLTPTFIRFGDLNLRAAEEDVDPQTRRVARILNHPNYKDESFYNDIALIQLTKPVIFTEFVRPIRLWYDEEIPFKYAFAMGFGAVKFAGAATNRLTEFNLTIIPNDICNMLLPKQPNIKDGIINSQTCATDYKKTASDTFQGDSGGPLQVSFVGPRQQSYLIGITSFGVIGATRYPGVYTRVSSYVDWIEQNVWSPVY